MYRTRRENFPFELFVSPVGVSSLFSPGSRSSGSLRVPAHTKLLRGGTEDLGIDCHGEMLGLISLKNPKH